MCNAFPIFPSLHVQQTYLELELESIQQKCDAWREEVEKLTPLRDEVAHLHQENARLQQEVARASEDNVGLGRLLQEMSSARRQVGELERKAAEYDQLMDRVTELQHVRVQLENELGPLRDEHAAILAENAALREGSQPEKYMQLKTNYSELSERCVELQKGLREESAVSKKMEEANSVLQKQLQEATDEKGLQAIRDRMERYKQEREQLRMSVAQLQAQLQSHREETQENQETISQLQQSLDEMAERGDQGPAGVWQKQIEVLSQKVEKYDKRTQRYREENATLREGSQPEKYMQLKMNYSELSEHCMKLQKGLTEETAISKTMEEANSVLQKQLQEATDEKGLQAIRDRMERYRQEREQLRMSVAQMQAQVLSHCEETQANQETISQLQQSLDEMAERGDQGPAGVWQKQIEVMSQKVEKYDKRMQRYRDERNTANILNTSLQQQIETLQSTVQQLQSSRAYSSYESGLFDSVDTSSAATMRKLQLQHDDSLQHRELSASSVEPYSPDAYSDTHSTPSTRSGMEPRKSSKRTSTGSTSTPHTGGVGELERKAAEYDQLIEQVTELQQIRVQLENELGPLKGEHAATLAENAALREGSQPEKYMQLKTNYSELSERCVKLQKGMTEESAISKKLEARSQ